MKLKVKDLIEILKSHDSNLEVVVDESLDYSDGWRVITEEDVRAVILCRKYSKKEGVTTIEYSDKKVLCIGGIYFGFLMEESEI
jgi:hypothetical protein